jgi:hypothetical protein
MMSTINFSIVDWRLKFSVGLFLVLVSGLARSFEAYVCSEEMGGKVSFVWLGTAELVWGRIFDCYWFIGLWRPKIVCFSFK